MIELRPIEGNCSADSAEKTTEGLEAIGLVPVDVHDIAGFDAVMRISSLGIRTNSEDRFRELGIRAARQWCGRSDVPRKGERHCASRLPAWTFASVQQARKAKGCLL
ncbi:hypothetical protein DSL72_005578 [Monilinia vaccinii-corymbosi]|uniref:Uncharacterized protein n=1 Tax=Monilinia vaccinii-corymbosi TaxID=61207 RepID=A0A8A3PFP8_9HELO|nr:hypothetical protein DSL72_005578 [Monilinia vaccinii-corymbosi]